MPSFLLATKSVATRFQNYRMAGFLIGHLLIASSVSAQEANGRFLAELRTIQTDYCQVLWYPNSQRRPDENRRWDHNERANASAGKSDQIQFPLQPGEEYLLTVYHVHKPEFGP